MSRRQLLAALLGLTAAAICARLGVWQLSRLRDRRMVNYLIASRLYAPPASVFRLAPGTWQWRRVVVTGTFDFDHQIVLAGRSHDGSPGVYLITPLHPDTPAPALLVNRGWVYSPDAQTVDLAKFDEQPHQTINAYVDAFATSGEGPARTANTPYAWRRLDVHEIRSAFPFPIAPFYLVAQADSGVTVPPNAPARLTLPVLDEGPHKSYAIQWFAFALIALVGAGVVIWRDRNVTAVAKP